MTGAAAWRPWPSWIFPTSILEQAKAAADAGCHVYMAKPIAVDVPGCLAIQSAAKLATEKKRCFLVDYQIPTEPANIEVANRIREGALGRLVHVLSYGFAGAWPDPPKGATIENRLRGGVWLSDIALGGDFIAYDIHIIDGVTWVMGKRPVRVCGSSHRYRLYLVVDCCEARHPPRGPRHTSPPPARWPQVAYRPARKVPAKKDDSY